MEEVDERLVINRDSVLGERKGTFPLYVEEVENRKLPLSNFDWLFFHRARPNSHLNVVQVPSQQLLSIASWGLEQTIWKTVSPCPNSSVKRPIAVSSIQSFSLFTRIGAKEASSRFNAVVSQTARRPNQKIAKITGQKWTVRLSVKMGPNRLLRGRRDPGRGQPHQE